MITPAFTKLQRSIITSSIWMEDAETRLVWVTMLALCDRDGIVRASAAGIAHSARVTREGCDKALVKFQQPDPDSRSEQYEGRRIERVDSGFRLLNYERVLSEGAREDRREYMRAAQEKHRAKLKAGKGNVVRPEHRDDGGKKPANGFRKKPADPLLDPSEEQGEQP